MERWLVSASPLLKVAVMKIRIEDYFEDVLGKAARGLGLSVSVLAQRSGLSESALERLFDGKMDLTGLRALAPELGLDADKLVAMALGKWTPQAAENVDGLRLYNTPCPVPGYPAMTVNNYLLFDPISRDAVIFDTGVAPQALLADLVHEGLQLKALFLTHTHFDHVSAYHEIIQASGEVQCYAPVAEPYADALPVAVGDSFQFGALSIHARETSGHSPGGTTYVVDGLAEKIAIVGDSIFCLSMGKADAAYAQALRNNREQILSLPAATILCPGHGPLTTVAEELEHNPFF